MTHSNGDELAKKIFFRPGEVIPAVPCKLCLRPTTSLNTRLCDNCWEINRRILGWSLWQHLKYWWRSRR